MKYVFLIFYATKYSTIRQQIYFFRVVFFFTVKLCVAEIVNVEPILVLRNGRSLQTTFVQSPGFVMVHTTYGRRLVFSFFVAPIVIFVPASVNSWLFFVLCPNQLGKDCHRLISPTVVACENARTHTRQSHVCCPSQALSTVLHLRMGLCLCQVKSASAHQKFASPPLRADVLLRRHRFHKLCSRYCFQSSTLPVIMESGASANVQYTTSNPPTKQYIQYIHNKQIGLQNTYTLSNLNCE